MSHCIWVQAYKWSGVSNHTCILFTIMQKSNTLCIFHYALCPQDAGKCNLQPNFNSSLPGQYGRHFADDIFRYIFVDEKFCILINISLKFVPKGPMKNIPALVQIIAWRRIGDKPLSKPNADPLHWRIYAALGGDYNKLLLNHCYFSSVLKYVFWS